MIFLKHFKFGVAFSLALLVSGVAPGSLWGGASPAIGQTRSDRQAEADNLLTRATWLDAVELIEDSLEVHEQAIQILQELGRADRVAEVLTGMAGSLQLNGYTEQALPYYQRALTIYQGPMLSPVDRFNQFYKASQTAHKMGAIYQAMGQLDEAIAMYQQALVSDRKVTPDSWMEALTLTKLGTVHRLAGRPDQAVAAYQQAAAIYQKSGGNPYDEPRLLNLGCCC